MKNHPYNPRGNLLSYLLLLTVFFILLEISFFVQGSEIYLGDFKLVAHHLQIPKSVYPEVAYFLAIQLLLHTVFIFIIWGMTRSIAFIFNLDSNKTEKLGLSLWFLGISLILLANQYYFPNSKFAYLVRTLLGAVIAKYLFFLLLLIFSIVIIFALCSLFFLVKNSFRITMGFLSVGLVVLSVLHFRPAPIIQDAATATRPNIIVIGIDSLRPDFLGYFGYEKQTPFLDDFLNQSTVFAEAFTPLARTFPAWVSILTGQYPKNSGVRFNLLGVGNYDWSHTLPSILRRAEYETIFSTDETRFSNIDKSYGFDKTLTPPMGVNDFLIGTLNDFPLSNLVVNTFLGPYLFPHSYGNRPAITTYNPNSFLHFIQPSLMQSRTKPVFLAIHFCLPHYPYFWGLNRADDKSINNYRASLRRVDQQFHDFMRLLQAGNFLNHAIVVVLSDHGEAIELQGDRVTDADLFISASKKKIPHFYPKSFDFEAVNQSAGHGTDVLSLSQYHIVLAVRHFGVTSNKIMASTVRTSLLDIKPTILDFLYITPDSLNDGVSLKNVIEGRVVAAHPKHFFYESDFSPQAVRTVHPETRKVLFEGMRFFQIDQRSGRITVRKDMEKLILSSKQFADLYGHWVLALYPQKNREMIPILVNLTNGKWTNDLSSSFAKNSPADQMLGALREFYGCQVSTLNI